MVPDVITTNTQTAQAENSAATMTAFYDGQCPVCRMEVRHYQRIGGDAVEWVDVCDLLWAMHVRDGETWRIGVEAFPALWRKMPVWRHFAWVFKVPGMTLLAKLGYQAFLSWQRWHRKRRSKVKTITTTF
jgi:predicted DCC family thiol-disulfide oxidoreductase YuxK